MEHAKLRTVGLVVLALVAGVALAGCMDDGGEESSDPGTDDAGAGDEGSSEDGGGDEGSGDDSGEEDPEGSDTVPGTELDTPSSWPMVGFTAAHTSAYGGPGDGSPEKAWTIGAPHDVAPSAGNGFVYIQGPSEDDARPTFRAFVPETADEAWRYHAESSKGTAVDTDHVYLVDRTGEEETPTALDAGTGEVAWTLEKDEFVSSAAPVIIGERVFFFDQGTEFRPETGTLFALEASTGEVDWEKEAPRADQLMTDGERLLVASGGEFYVFDANTGDEVSSIDTGARQAYQSVADGTLFTVERAATKAWDLESGEEVWTYELEQLVDGPPSVVDGLVFLGGSSTDEPGRVYALDAQTGEEEWVFETSASWVSPSPAIAHSTVYVATQGDGEEYTFYAIDAEDGTEAWSFSVEPELRDPSPPTSITFLDGMLFADMGAYWVALDV